MGDDRSTSRQGDTPRTWEQEVADRDLGHYPHRLEVRGRPQTLTWPDVCAHCGGRATERIRVRRAFYRRARGRGVSGAGYRVVSAAVPFCAACAARHRAMLPERSWLSRYGWFVFNPAHVATIGCAVLLTMVLRSGLGTPGVSPGWQLNWGLAGLFAFGIVWTIAITWWMTRPSRFEPPTDVTSACRISNGVGQFFEGRRHVYGFRNQAFADAFARANQPRLWTSRDQARMWKTSLVATALIIALFGGVRAWIWYAEGW